MYNISESTYFQLQFITHNLNEQRPLDLVANYLFPLEWYERFEISFYYNNYYLPSKERTVAGIEHT